MEQLPKIRIRRRKNYLGYLIIPIALMIIVWLIIVFSNNLKERSKFTERLENSQAVQKCVKCNSNKNITVCTKDCKFCLSGNFACDSCEFYVKISDPPFSYFECTKCNIEFMIQRKEN